MLKFIIKITFISLLSLFSLFAATETLDAEAGTGTANGWNAGGADVGTDCSVQGGTESNIASKNSNLSVPIENSSGSGVISSVQVRVYARSSVPLDPGDGIVVHLFDGWALYADATTYEPATTLTYYSATWNDSPITSTTWTWAEVDAIEAGCRSIATGGSSIDILYVDHIELIVTYNNPPVVTGLTAAANLDNDAAQLTDGSGQVVVDFEVSDPD